MSNLIIQHISIRWTKKSRGMPAAGIRNAIPEAFALPEMPHHKPNTSPNFAHLIRANEHQQFALLSSTELISGSGYKSRTVHPWRFLREDDQLHISHYSSHQDFIASRLSTLRSLNGPSYVRLIRNDSYRAHTFFHRQVCNIAFGLDYDPLLFTRRPVDEIINQTQQYYWQR